MRKKLIKNILKGIFICPFLLLSISGFTQNSIFGKWKTVDDETGKVRSVVEIFEKDGKAYGKILQLFRETGEDQDPVCTECTDHRKGEKIIGLQIIEGLKQDGKDWEGGEILDPENGKVYRCKIWREGDQLKVRGYLYFFYRTQTWLPYN